MSDADDTETETPDEAPAEALDGSIPEELCPASRAVWAHLAPDLVKMGRVKRTDRQALTRYCDLVAEYWAMSNQIRAEGSTILVPTIAKDGDGKAGAMWRRHPLLAERRALAGALKDLEDRFGMSPLARANLTLKLLGRSGGDGDLFNAPGADGNEAGDDADPARFN
ncbi:MAG: phage terminase small subunit P27 family [Acidobacteria bacterium]|nr:phage terminase small subunit P27 family [Acidobacteriota bacterium]